MRLLPYYNKKSQTFAKSGIQDKLLTSNGIRYLLFFESDEPFRELETVRAINFPFRMFYTKNGFHVIGFGVHTAKEKISWFEAWKNVYPNSDYFINRSVLRPHSYQELLFITTQAFSVTLLSEPMICVYYRDKAVFETYESGELTQGKN